MRLGRQTRAPDLWLSFGQVEELKLVSNFTDKEVNRLIKIFNELDIDRGGTISQVISHGICAHVSVSVSLSRCLLSLRLRLSVSLSLCLYLVLRWVCPGVILRAWVASHQEMQVRVRMLRVGMHRQRLKLVPRSRASPLAG